MLISLITIKPSLQLIYSLTVDKEDIELNENIEDLEDSEEIKAEFISNFLNNSFLLSSRIISKQSKIVLDSYTKEAINLTIAVTTPPPKHM